MVMGAPISIGYLRAQGLPDAQLLPTAGGEHFDFDGFTVDAILAHHSILPREVLQKLGDALAADTSPLSPEEQQQREEIRARGLSDPLIITQGTIAYLFTFDNGFKLVYRNSAGPITDTERAAMEQLGSTDQATEPLFIAIRDTLPNTRSVSPLYRTPVAVDMLSKNLLVGA